jgi:hypothetical protein
VCEVRAPWSAKVGGKYKIRNTPEIKETNTFKYTRDKK